MAAVGTMNYPPRDSFQGYPQQYAIYQARAPQPQSDASSIAVNPYAAFQSAVQQQAAYPQPARSNQPSPVSEDGPKPSLPSISNLLGIVDADRPNQEHGARSQQIQQPTQPQAHSQPQQIPQTQQHPQQQQHYPTSAVKMDQRPQIVSYPPQDMSSNQRTIIPPTPPMRSDSIGETTQSPSTISTGSSLSAQPYFIGSALNNIEADQQRVALAHMNKRPSVPSQPNTSPYGTSPYATTAYSTSPGALSSGSFYSPEGYAVTNLYSQRPLPSNFPPQNQMGTSQPAPSMPTTNPWEHHHFINPSSQATYPQSQDRYICQTCNKAFSRPSSLKIHSHSHTGEKPFKCPHAGCGKAFSVRSNMKRHERGCHTGSGRVMMDAHMG